MVLKILVDLVNQKFISGHRFKFGQPCVLAVSDYGLTIAFCVLTRPYLYNTMELKDIKDLNFPHCGLVKSHSALTGGGSANFGYLTFQLNS